MDLASQSEAVAQELPLASKLSVEQVSCLSISASTPKDVLSLKTKKAPWKSQGAFFRLEPVQAESAAIYTAVDLNTEFADGFSIIVLEGLDATVFFIRHFGFRFISTSGDHVLIKPIEIFVMIAWVVKFTSSVTHPANTSGQYDKA